MGNPHAIWVGHDGREPEATTVCEMSLRKHSKAPLFIQRLHEPALRHIGMYRREWTVTDGVKYDQRDRRPFSTAFAFSRFLVPSLMQHAGWALFVDADFLFRADVGQLFAQADPKYAAMVVKHEPLPQAGRKMDGQIQQPYFRKNWSSCILFNCAHTSNQRLGPFQVNGMAGQWLHAFSWLEDAEIGALDPLWNHLVGVQPYVRDVKAAHFTLGIPTMPGHERDAFAEEWRALLALANG